MKTFIVIFGALSRSMLLGIGVIILFEWYRTDGSELMLLAGCYGVLSWGAIWGVQISINDIKESK